MSVPKIKIGCCGFPVSMKKYFELFKLVEVQRTFYTQVRFETLERWRSQAGDGEFTLKALQFITHPPTSPTYRRAGIKIPEDKKKNYGFFRNTEEVFSAYNYTKKAAEILKAKIVVFQTPASFRAERENIENMENFFDSVDRGNLRFGFEPRGKSWKPEIVERLCRRLDLIHVVDPFKAKPALKSEIAYFRLHGITGYRYSYSLQELRELLEMCRRSGAQEVYVLFNNTQMLENALTFKESVYFP